MNLDELEELIRRYLTAGITAVVIVLSPGTGTDGTPAEPEVRIIEPAPSAPEPEAAPRADPDRTGASGSDPGAEPEPESGTDEGSAGSEPETGPDPGTDSGTESGTDPGTGTDRRETEEDSAPDSGSEPRSSPSSETEAESGTEPGAGSEDADAGSGSTSGETGSDTGAEGEAGRSDESGAGAGGDSTEDTGGERSPGRAETRSDETGAEADTGSGAETGSDAGSTPGRNINVEGTTAAEVHGWGAPEREEDFSGGLADWNVYNGPGHAGQGIRSPAAASTENGILTITGDSEGTTAGMAWLPGQMYGRWEGRVRAPVADESYNALLLLWPDAENFPVGGEIDFMEMLDHTRQTTDIFIHYGEDNSQVNGQVETDGTEWHNWAVEWTPEAITAYVDGEEWYRTTDTSIFPPGPMHLCVQLDWFPDDAEGPVQESQMHVDWVRYYPLDESTGSESRSRRGTGESPRESTDAGTDESDEDAGGAETGTPRRWAGFTGETSENRGQSEEETDPFSRFREAIRRLFYWR